MHSLSKKRISCSKDRSSRNKPRAVSFYVFVVNIIGMTCAFYCDVASRNHYFPSIMYLSTFMHSLERPFSIPPVLANSLRIAASWIFGTVMIPTYYLHRPQFTMTFRFVTFLDYIEFWDSERDPRIWVLSRQRKQKRIFSNLMPKCIILLWNWVGSVVKVSLRQYMSKRWSREADAVHPSPMPARNPASVDLCCAKDHTQSLSCRPRPNRA